MRVFISYSSKDETLARRIKNRFQAKDYLVFFAPDSIPEGTDYATVIADAIVDASKEGAVIALITPESLQSQWVKHEIMFASHEGGNIIPVIVGNAKLDGVLRFELLRRQMYNLSDNPTDDEIDEMIDQVGRSILN